MSIIKGKIPTDDVSSFTNLLRFMQLISSNFSHHWILICINPLDGNVYYFNSYLSAMERNFEDVKTFIDR